MARPAAASSSDIRNRRPVPELLKRLDLLLFRLLGVRYLVARSDLLLLSRLEWAKAQLGPGAGTILDVGCGNGAADFSLAGLGHRVLGVDTPERIQECEVRRNLHKHGPRLSFQALDIRHLDDLEASGFDDVVCMEVIEHIMDDRKLMKDMANKLRPGGKLLLTTPALGYPPLRGDFVSPVEDGSHVRWGYNEGMLRALFDEAGLVAVRMDFLVGKASRAIATGLRRLSTHVPSPLLGAIQLTLLPLTRLDAVLPSPPLCLAAVAEKRRRTGQRPKNLLRVSSLGKGSGNCPQ